MKVTYHAWIAEDLGIIEENIDDADDSSLYDLLNTIKKQNKRKEEIFSKMDNIYIALNNKLINKNSIENTNIKAEDTISFFPAISGG